MNSTKTKKLLQSIGNVINYTNNYAQINFQVKEGSKEKNKATIYKKVNNNASDLFKKITEEENNNTTITFINNNYEEIKAKFAFIDFKTNYMNYSADFEVEAEHQVPEIITFTNNQKPFGELYLQSSTFKDELEKKGMYLPKKEEDKIHNILQFSNINLK